MKYVIDNFWNIITIVGFVIGIWGFLDGRVSKKKAKEERALNAYVLEIAPTI